MAESTHWFLFYFFHVENLPVDFIISIFDCVSWLTLLFKRCLQLSSLCSFTSRGYWHLYNQKESRLQKSGYSITEANINFNPGNNWAVYRRAPRPSYVYKLYLQLIQYIPRNMHTVVALLCFAVLIHWLIFPYPSGLLHWHCGNLTIAPVPAKQPWWIWINTSCEFIMNDCITTTKQSTTKPCAYFLGYTVLYITITVLSCNWWQFHSNPTWPRSFVCI